MDRFEIKIESDALADLGRAMGYYEKKEKGQGVFFYEKFDFCLSTLESNPYNPILYEGRVRCFTIPTFPFLIHFYIDEHKKFVHIIGIIKTDNNH